MDFKPGLLENLHFNALYITSSFAVSQSGLTCKGNREFWTKILGMIKKFYIGTTPVRNELRQRKLNLDRGTIPNQAAASAIALQSLLLPRDFVLI